MDRTFVLCLDMQPVFIRAVQNGAVVLRRCQLALGAAAGLGIATGLTEQVPEKLGRTVPELTAAHPAPRNWSKSSFSALAHEPLRQFLCDEFEIEHLVLCGIETPICVYQTAIAAKTMGLEVTILCDAVGARRPDDARACLDTLARAGVHILPTETVFYSLLENVAHPFFKTYTELVKSHA